MKYLIPTICLTILFAFYDKTHAQEATTSGKSGIGPKIGYYKAPDADDGAMFFGIQTRTRGEIFGFELATEYRGEQGYTINGSEVTVSQIPVTTSLMMHVPMTSNFQPYGLIGLGAYYTIYDYDNGFVNPGDDTELKIGYHLGFGLDLPLNESAGLNVDYRYLFLNGSDSLNDKEFSGNVISAGLTFYF